MQLESKNLRYISALCALDENEFTKDIIKPLFEAMGYERVDYNGGPYERGRDLIAQRSIPPGKKNYVAYVQSKKVGDIQNTATATKLSTLMHQLRQCCTGKLTNSDGEQILPDQVFLACPEQISNRLREEINSQLHGIPVKIHLYDGPSIISDINTYKPALFKLLTNFEEKLTSMSHLDFKNEELLSALKSNSRPSFRDFYSDLSFFVGSFDSNLLLHLEIEFKDDVLSVEEEHWSPVKKELENIRKQIGFAIHCESLEHIEGKFIEEKIKYESSTNKKVKKKYKELRETISDIQFRIKEHLKNLEDELKKIEKDNPRDQKITEYNEVYNYLVELASGGNRHYPKKLIVKRGGAFDNGSNLILSLIKDEKKILTEIKKLKTKIIIKPCYFIKIKNSELADKINHYKKRYYADIEAINCRQLNFSKLKTFLSETQNMLSLVSKLMNDNSALSRILSFKKDKYIEDRVSISPHDIFSTNHDIALYGEAGVGKTTTLQAYVNIVKDNIIYIPLNKLVDKFKKVLNETTDINWLKTDLLMKIILLSRSLDPICENLEELKVHLSKKPTLVLDGLDEVYNTIPGLIPAISIFKSKYPSIQLIVSSRDCVSYLNEINFLGITLLPFTKDQLNRFIRGWLKNKDIAEKLIKSIVDRELFEHVKTPLLATITCSLVEKGINAPSTENEIYSERLRLLTGEYDLHKNIQRQKHPGQLLRKCTIKIALSMHMKGIRSLSKADLLEILQSNFSENHTKALLSDCLEELINPCNILIFEPITQTYSFGHFRFQEHLASEGLKVDRSINLSALTLNDWWRGALCLYAQDNNIYHVFEEVFRSCNNIQGAKITLEEMIANSHFSQRVGLRKLMTQHEKTYQYEDKFLLDQDYYNFDDYSDI